MKIKNICKVLLTSLGVSFLLTAQANLIVDLGKTTGQPSDIPSELGRLNTQITLYNDNYNPDLILAEGWTGTKTKTLTSPTSITLDLTGFDGYLLFKWGNIDHFYFINDLVTAPYSPSTVIYNGNGSYTFLSDVTPHSNLIPGTYSFYLTRPQNYLGLSHYTKFDSLTTVPETTTFLAGWLLIFPFIASFIKHKKTGSV